MVTTNPDVIESPAIAKLRDELGSNTDALAAFWAEVATHGAPLFEAYDEETRTWLVTFVWREDGPTENVVLLEWVRPIDFPAKVMTHLPGTDLWYASIRMFESVRTQYGFAPNDNLVPKREETDWEARRAKWTTDPFNPETVIDPDSPALQALRSWQSAVLSLPSAKPQPWIVRRDEVIRGEVTEHTFAGEILGNERQIWLYKHPDAAGTVPLLVQFDGDGHADIFRTPTVLDNLVADGAIPPLVAIFVGNVDRGEELPCNADFVRMLSTELVPWALNELDVRTTADLTVANGVSYGGLAAMFAGLTAPETFGLVASQSGSFWWKPNPMDYSRTIGVTDEYQWLPTQVVDWPQADIRIWMEAGTLEGRGFQDFTPTLLDSNRHMRNVLRARGYDVTYREFDGGHDYSVWRDSQADALIHLLGK
ncbi:MAG: enterochelin esterase [Thermomicrobiales bacterium]|nr:enterochelin esterase [Thermomicrobiales bacterium]